MNVARLLIPIALQLLAALQPSWVGAAVFNPPDANRLIKAVHDANANADPVNTINLDRSGNYTLTKPYDTARGFDPEHGLCYGNALPSIFKTLIINGNGATIAGNGSGAYDPPTDVWPAPYPNLTTNQFRILHVAPTANLTLNEVAIAGGTGHFDGGAICNGGALLIRNSLVKDSRNLVPLNRYPPPANPQVMTPQDLQNNPAHGEDYGGGAIVNLCYATLTVENTTVSNNTSYGRHGGGGILNYDACRNGATNKVVIVHSTIFENQANGKIGQGGWAGHGDAIATLFGQADPMTLKNSVLASPTRGLGAACDTRMQQVPTIISLGHNLVYPDLLHCGLTPNANSYAPTNPTDLAADPQLGPLANNGGPTWTHLPKPLSPVVDKIPPSSTNKPQNCTDAGGSTPVVRDQRAITRPQGTMCDIGAVEVAQTRLVPLTIGKVVALKDLAFSGGTFSFNVNCTNPASSQAVSVFIPPNNLKQYVNAPIQLPIGATCTVTESAPTVVPGGAWSAPAFSPAAGQFTVTPPGNTVVATNTLTRTPRPVDVRVVKTLSLPAGTAFPGGLFTIAIACHDSSHSTYIYGPVTQQISIAVGSTVGLATFASLPAGADCQLLEDLQSLPAVNGMSWGAPMFSPPSSGSPPNGTSFVPVGPGAMTINVTNRLIAAPSGTSTVSIRKGDVAGMASGTFSFVLACGATHYGPYTVTYPGPNTSATPAISVPTGATCTVREVKLPALPAGKSWAATFYYAAVPLTKCAADPLCANVTISPGASTIVVINRVSP